MLTFILEVFTVATVLASAGYVVAGAYQFIRRKLAKQAAWHDAPPSEPASPLVSPVLPYEVPCESPEPPPASEGLHKPELPTMERDRAFSTSAVALVVVVAIACSVVLWMERYRFEQINLENGESYPVRINRVTGNSEVLYGGDWKAAAELPRLLPLIQDLDARDVEKLKGEAKLDSELPVFQVSLYNGSGFTLQEITVEMTVKDSHGEELLRREYRIGPHLKQHHLPKQQADYLQDLGFNIAPQQTWFWRITAARRIKGSR